MKEVQSFIRVIVVTSKSESIYRRAGLNNQIGGTRTIELLRKILIHKSKPRVQ